uniref:Uncharacterized protein n=1 Tax=Picea sitchensis TaxID=3332 RepID=A9NLX0_PICSI|nr:unknown [Picea sitchensis]
MEWRLKLCIVTYLNIFLALSEPKLTYAKSKATKPLVTAMYIFGDSTVDPGNNNGLETIAKANFPPYGRDFIGRKPSGRFTNGKLVTDIISGLAGLPDIVPAYLDPEFRGPRILTGASFASAGSGYDDITPLTVNVLTLEQQLDNFKLYREKLVNMLGPENSSEVISGALFVISMGTNDFSNNYYLNPSTRAHYTIDEFQDHVLHTLSRFIENIYKEGASLLGLIGLPPFGCLPSQITLYHLTGDACVDEFNDVAISFNHKAASLVKTLKPILPGLKIAYIDIYDKPLDIIKNPSKYGFEEARRGCCGTGTVETAMLCNPTTPVCPDPSKYVFWDSVHPTGKVYNIVGQDIFSQCVSSLF